MKNFKIMKIIVLGSLSLLLLISSFYLALNGVKGWGWVTFLGFWMGALTSKVDLTVKPDNGFEPLKK